MENIDKQIEAARRISKQFYEASSFEYRTDGVVQDIRDSASSGIGASSRRKIKGDSTFGSPSTSVSMPDQTIGRIFDFSSPKSSKYNIIPEIYGISNNSGNAIQHNIENAQKLANLKDGQAYIAMISDMEWVGKGDGIATMPTEFGFVPVLVTKDGLKPLTDNASVDAAKNAIDNPLGFKAQNFGIGIYGDDATTVQGMIGKLKRKETLNPTEYRTLKDLASYGKDVDIDPKNMIVGRTPSGMLINGQDLSPYVDQIQKGFDLMSTSKKAMARNDVNVEMAQQVIRAKELAEKSGFSVEGNMFVFHNAFGADLKAVRDSFGEDSPLYKMISENVIDTQSLATALGADSPGNYKGSVKGYATMETLLRQFSPERAGKGTAHVGGSDSIDLAYLFNGMLKDSGIKSKIKNAKLQGDALNIGDELFSVNSISKFGMGSSPIDSLYQKNAHGKIEMVGYHNTVAYKHSIFQIKNEFTEVVDGKKYYGMVLHNTDDDVYSVVGRETVEELRDVVQQNFKTKGNVKNYDQLRSHGLDDKARRAYRSMFTDKNSYGNFNSYFGAAKEYAGGKSVDELGLSPAKKRNFLRIKDRLVEELPFLDDFNDKVLNTLDDDYQKTVALNSYYDTFTSNVYARDGAFKNLEDLYLPNELFKNGTSRPLQDKSATEVSRAVLDQYNGILQGKIYRPDSKSFTAVNLGSITDFTKSINNTIAANTSRTPNMTMADGVGNLTDFVHEMANTGVIEESKARKLLKVMSSADAYHGTGKDARRGLFRISGYVAEEIHGDVLKWNMQHHLINKVDQQERLRVAKVEKGEDVLNLVRGEKNANYDNIRHRAKNYHATLSTNPKTNMTEYLTFRSKEAETALRNIDDYQKRYVSAYIPNVKSGKIAGPKSIIDNLNELAEQYYKQDLIMDISMEKGNKGMIMSLYDKNLSEATAKTARIHIPMVDVNTGFIDFQGRQNSNVLRPVRVFDRSTNKYTKEFRVDTYLNKALESLVYTSKREEIGALVRAGDIDQAEAVAKRSLNAAIKGIPGGSHGLTVDDQLNKGSRLAFAQKGAMMDTNDLFYQNALYANRSNLSIQNIRKEAKNEYLREVAYGDDIIRGLYGGRSAQGQDMRNALGEILDGKHYLSPLKSERVKEGFVSTLDNREFVSFGQFADVGRENIRQRANYIYLGKSDELRPGSSRMDVINRYAGKDAGRYTRKLVGTERYFGYSDAAIPGIESGIDGLNLKTAIVNNMELQDLLKDDMSKVPFMARPHVHDDTVFMRAEIAEAFGYMEERKFAIDSGDDIVSILNTAKSGETILSPDKLNEKDIFGGFRDYNMKSDSVFQSIGVNQDTGAYELTVRMIHGGEEGMKVGTAGGNKATVRLLNKKGWEKAFKAEYHDLDMIANFGLNKMPQDIIDSELRHMVYEMDTVGKRTSKEIQETVRTIIRNTFEAKGDNAQKAMNDMINSVNVVRGEDGARLILPNEISGKLRIGEFTEQVNNALTDRGLEGIKRNGHLVASVNVLRADVNDVHNVIDSSGGEKGVKIGLRELEMFKNRRFLDDDLRLTKTVDLMEKVITQNAMENTTTSRNMMNTLLDAGGASLVGDADYKTVRTRGDLGLGPGEMLFEDVNRIPSKGPYSKTNLRGTIMDLEKFGGDAFWLQLDKEVDLGGGKKVNRLLMPILPAEGIKDNIYLTEVQKSQRNIFEDTMILRNIDETNVNDRVLANKARDRLYGKGGRPGSINRYLTEVANATMSSKGQVYENMMTTRVDASVQLKFAAVNPMDKILGLDGLDEGSILLGRDDMQKMLGKLPDEQVQKMMETASTDGITGMGIRYPTTQYGSIQTVKYRTLSREAEEKALEAGVNLSGKAYVTVGTQARWSADFDGDTFSGFLPQLAGRKVNRINTQVQDELDKIHSIERKWDINVAGLKNADIELEKNTKTILQNMWDDVGGSKVLETIDPILDGGARFAEVESRILKDVGPLSNMALKYRRMAETVGTMARKEAEMHPVVSAFGTSIEQLSISSKKFGETVMEKMATEGQEAGMDFATNYINSYAGLVKSLDNFDADGIIQHSMGLGIFDKETQMFSGSVKSEGEIVEQTFKNGNFSATDLKRALYEMKDYDQMLGGDNTLWDSYINLGVSKHTNASSGINAAVNLASGDSSAAMMSSYTGGQMTRAILFGEENIEDITEDQIQSRLEEIRISKGTMASTPSREVFEGAASTTAATQADNLAGKVMGGGQLGKAVGVSLAGMWAVGRVFGGVSEGVSNHRGQTDQAPASDGEYVNPGIYAGAPQGAGPTARLAERGSGYEKMNVNISGNAMSGMTNEEVASLVSEEIQRQAGMSMSINVNSQDDRTSLNKNWLQQQFSLALDSGYSH